MHLINNEPASSSKMVGISHQEPRQSSSTLTHTEFKTPLKDTTGASMHLLNVRQNPPSSSSELKTKRSTVFPGVSQSIAEVSGVYKIRYFLSRQWVKSEPSLKQPGG